MRKKDVKAKQTEGTEKDKASIEHIVENRKVNECKRSDGYAYVVSRNDREVGRGVKP